MKKLSVELPVITIDNALIKSTAERNKENVSQIGEELDIRTPNHTKVEPLPLPRFSITEGPWTYFRDDGGTPYVEKDGQVFFKDNSQANQDLARWREIGAKWVPPAIPNTVLTEEQQKQKALADWSDGIDYQTSLEKLIQPRTDIVTDPAQIESWLRKNIHLMARPMHYVGHEANMDDPSLYGEADLRVLIVRLSPYDSVNGSLTHGAMAQLARQTARQGGWKVYTDMTYMPGLSKDAEIFRERKIPYMFGRTSKRPMKDFDIVLFSFALTMEVWNIIPTLAYSGIAPFQDMRRPELPLDHPERSPVILFGGVVSDFIEVLYGKVGDHECVCDATVIGDGEYTLPLVLQLLHDCKKQGKTKAEFLKLGHTLPSDGHFERDASSGKKFSWWYQPYAYEHIFSDKPDEKTGYIELRKIKRKEGYEYAVPPGQLKRAVVRDLNDARVWEEAPVQYDGTLGPSVDIQISSGCLCVAGNTVIETDFGFETIKEAYERLQDPDEVGGVLVQTREALQSAEKIVYTGKKMVRDLIFRDEDGKHEYRITCTEDHKFDTGIQGDAERDWQRAGDLQVGQEVWAVDPEFYNKAREVAGKQNIGEQNYYAHLHTMELKEIGKPYEADCYDIINVDNHEYIANGLITHNSGGLCSFCLAEGTLVSTKGGKQVRVETLEDFTFKGQEEDRELDTPYGLQTPEGVKYTGEKKCIKITSERGHSITVTPDHEIMTYREGLITKVPAGELVAGKDVVVLVQGITGDRISKDDQARNFLYPAALRPKALKNKERMKSLETEGKVSALLALKEPTKEQITKEQKEWYRVLRKAHAYSDVIAKIEDAGIHKTYDVWNVEKGHVFYANGFVVGNCHEAHTQGRWRERSLDVIKDAAERAIRKQGAEQVSFYSLTWSLHSKIYSLLLWTYHRFGNTNLISQRADQSSADPNFFLFQNRNGERSATVGVEGISQRMRNYFNKSLHTDQLIRACENAANAGYASLKWFMILSGMETDEDVKDFCNLLRYLHRKFKEIAKNFAKTEGRERSPLRINPSFMLLINLPHTALQWGPCASSMDLESDTLRPVVEVTRECGFGFRTSLTRDRVRIAQWVSVAGREATKIVAEVCMRSNFLYYGPIPKRVTWLLHEKIYEAGYDWMYYFREKTWDHLFPWDAIATPMRRDYLWNQWLRVRESQGIAYCLKTSINPNPRCHDCGACGDNDDRKFMLTRQLEDSKMLDGQEAARRDMTPRKKVRWDLEVTYDLLRTAPKDILARNVVRAFMLAASEKKFDHRIVTSYLHVDGHSLKFAEGKGNLPWVMGHVLVDTVFNQNWPDREMQELLPRINEILAESYPKENPGLRVNGFVSGDKLVQFDESCFALYTVEIEISQLDLKTNLELFNEKEKVKYKTRVSVGRDIFRMEEVIALRSDTVPMAYLKTTKSGRISLTFMCSLTVNPIQILTVLTGKRAMHLKAYPVACLGYYKYGDASKKHKADEIDDDDLFAALENRAVRCRLTKQKIETDLFTGELYRSKSGPDLCVAADLGGLIKMREMGIKGGGATVKVK